MHVVNTATTSRQAIITFNIDLDEQRDEQEIRLGDISLDLFQDGDLSSVDIVLDDDNTTEIAFSTQGRNRSVQTRAAEPPFSASLHNSNALSTTTPAFLAFDTTYTMTALLYTTPHGDMPFSHLNLRQTLVLTFTFVHHAVHSTPNSHEHASQSRLPTKPNIVLILADDLAWPSTSVEMRKGQVNSRSPVSGFVTANIERLAEDGIVFSRAYSCGPQCVPARGCIISGQTAARNRLTVTGGGRRKDTFQYEKPKKYGESPMIGVLPQELDDTMLSLPRALELQGYTSATPASMQATEPD